MKKNISLLICFLVTQFLISQEKSGRIIYKVKPTQDYDEWVDSTTAEAGGYTAKFVKKEMNKTKKATPHLYFNLTFNTNEAIFKHPNSMENDNGIDLDAAARSTGVDGVYYINSNKKIMLHQFKDDKNWLIHSKTDTLDWKILNETKEIAGYKTQKARTTINLNSSKRGEITVWFAPELPFQFGPIGLSGLPGMILEVNRNHYVFYADDITFKDKTKKIKKPKTGKKATIEEYYKFVNDWEENNDMK